MVLNNSWWSLLEKKMLEKLGGGFKYVLFFTPKIGEDESILTNMFQRGWFNHQLERNFYWQGFLEE